MKSESEVATGSGPETPRPRRYVMRSRARSAAATRERILSAAAELMAGRLRGDIRLRDVAAGAGVTVQTVLRAYGSRESLLDKAFERVLRQMRAELHRAEPGDVVGTVRALFDHYERFGDVVIGNLVDESDPAVAPVVRVGRRRHRAHVRRQFAVAIAACPPAGRTAMIDALACVTDVYAWKLLRRDARRSRPAAERAMVLMVESLVASSDEPRAARVRVGQRGLA